MTQRSVLITGCSSGIGYAAAKQLHDKGWQVIASARDASDVERLKAEGLQAVQLDLASPDSIAMALDWTLKLTNGRLDALFNNGAFAIPGAVEDLSRSALAYQLDNTLLGWHELTIAVLPIMRRQGFGRIINNSSVLGLAAMRYRGAYVASKFALEGLTDVLRMELHGSGIYVSLIEPGPITSHFRKNAYLQFNRWIDAKHSLHKVSYLKMIQRLESEKKAPFTLSPDAVVKVLIHALESKKPKSRYYVTKATWLMGLAKRLLSTQWMDRFTRKIAEKENEYYEPKIKEQ
ncbi:SDR family NAD(P)-dependent oxidoreductase [Suttonella ornithocola]|uniref:3-oxoacyl-[acyl-carrier-protein] reductase FabG n=1 Tax=Suttonella ornithocola TaxID=279832 RepID=A0A380MQZ8_9GAMM|nr:SDR family NAD(P)-dependent oxidoreductase [Suttonella ornithocola]SUO94742.1 3-oxoacyl-[acyl-carrier-protein] reductase FabG [Suttonella ornithocola]